MEKATFKGIELTPEIEAEATAYIESLMDKEFTEVDALAKTDWRHCRLVMKFFQIKEKTDLHKRFREKFLDPLKQINSKYEEGRLKGLMKSNKEAFIKEHLIDEYQFSDVKYHIINRYFVWEWDNEDEILSVAIPYFSQIATRDKFGYWIEISKKKTPEFFQEIAEKMKPYKWNASLTSNKK